MATKIKKPKVKLNEKAKAKDAAMTLELKKDRAAERKLNKKKAVPEDYSKDVVAAIEAYELEKLNPKVHREFTPIVEKELDIAIAENSLAEYKADPTKGGSLNTYYIKLYDGFLITLTKELKALKKKN
jgi:hypothetical protein